MDPVFHDLYTQIKKQKRIGVRSWLRHVSLIGLSMWNEMNHKERWLQKPRIQFLYLHHIFRDEEAPLRKLIERLLRDHTFISYSEGVDRILQNRIEKPYIIMSSDDGLKNNLAGASIMMEYGIPGCFFINPGIVGEKNYDTIQKYCQQNLHFPTVEFMDWSDIEFLQKQGHEIGSHTMFHMNVARTSSQAIADDMAATFAILQQKCGGGKHFAFPFGRFFHFNETGRKACFDAGYISCASAERGCHMQHVEKIPKESLCIRRDHIILDWDYSHIEYFMVQNVKNANPQNHTFPYAVQHANYNFN